jgi:2',3'-cyclic-nucleotide 2'-phosphodiesterase (5'-nucleotidase family)
MMKKIPALHLLAILFFLSCRSYMPVKGEWDLYHLEQQKINRPSDSAIISIVSPYKLRLDSQMNRVIGHNLKTLSSKKPEGSLGDFFADAVREESSDKFGRTIDLALFNSGGLRIPSIAQGDIKVSAVYELMPFENEVVVMEVEGTVLKKILSFSASRGGDPVSGARYRIRNNEATEISIGGKPLDENHIYVLLTNDYMANGGDNFDILKNIPRQTKNLKIRDLLFTYFEKHPEPLNIEPDGRVQIYQP